MPWPCGLDRLAALPPVLFVVESLLHFLGVAFVVELEQAGEDFTAGGFADRVADALLRLVEAVAEVEVGPAVGGGDGVVHLDVELTELLDVGAGFVGVVEAVVGLGQSFLSIEHDLPCDVVVILFANVAEGPQMQSGNGNVSKQSEGV